MVVVVGKDHAWILRGKTASRDTTKAMMMVQVVHNKPIDAQRNIRFGFSVSMGTLAHVNIEDEVLSCIQWSAPSVWTGFRARISFTDVKAAQIGPIELLFGLSLNPTLLVAGQLLPGEHLSQIP